MRQQRFFRYCICAKQANRSALNGDTKRAPIPHTITFADDSPIEIMILQRNDFVKSTACYNTI